MEKVDPLPEVIPYNYPSLGTFESTVIDKVLKKDRSDTERPQGK